MICIHQLCVFGCFNVFLVCLVPVYVYMLLSGPSGVGVNELRRKLIEINPRTFLGPVPRQYALDLTPLIIRKVISLFGFYIMRTFCAYRHDEATEDVRGAQARVSLPQ